MQQAHFLQREPSLLTLYEQNYMLFRLVLPELPGKDGWFALESAERPVVYVHRLAIHPYTSEWLLGHFHPHKRERRFTPDHVIRVYHDARLVEAMVREAVPVNQMRKHKLARNRALYEWLDYCRRYRYRLNLDGVVTHLPLAEAIR